MSNGVWFFYVLFAALMIVLSRRAGFKEGWKSTAREAAQLAYRYQEMYVEMRQDRDRLRQEVMRLRKELICPTPTEGQAEDAVQSQLLGSLPSLGNTPSKWGSS